MNANKIYMERSYSYDPIKKYRHSVIETVLFINSNNSLPIRRCDRRACIGLDGES